MRSTARRATPRQAALPYTVNPYLGKDESKGKQLAEFVAKYDRPHTKGCLFSGAG